jgi:RNA polymerase sigma-70 factor, ECF subfamily
MNEAGRAWRERGLRDAALGGRQEAWRALFDAAYEPVRAFVRWRLGGRDDGTDDLVQEAWLVAVRKLAAFDPERGSFCQWVRGIAGNLVLNHVRNGRVRRTRPLVENDERVSGNEADLQRAEKVAWTLAQLSPRHEQALRAKYVDGLSVDAMATEWNETPKAVESLLTRARQAFRELYEKTQP